MIDFLKKIFGIGPSYKERLQTLPLVLVGIKKTMISETSIGDPVLKMPEPGTNPIGLKIIIGTHKLAHVSRLEMAHMKKSMKEFRSFPSMFSESLLDTWELWPCPADIYPVTIEYYERPEQANPSVKENTQEEDNATSSSFLVESR